MNPRKGYEHPKIGELIDGSFLYLNEVAGEETWTPTSLCLGDKITIEEASVGIYCRPINMPEIEELDDLKLIITNRISELEKRVYDNKYCYDHEYHQEFGALEELKSLLERF